VRDLTRAPLPVLAAVCMAAGCSHTEREASPPFVTAAAATSGSDTVHVAAPTGERETDRASILAALEKVTQGSTVQFAAGTYLIGQIIAVPVSRITLVGHAQGTTLRGCDPEEWAIVRNPRASCNTLELLGSHQTVRDLTFEYMSLGLTLGPGSRGLAGLATGDEEALINSITGGHRIEGNTFRESSNGIRGDGRWSEPIVIRGNRFINTYHAVSFAGSHVHLLDNDISVPEPERVPITGHPGLAVQFAGTNEHFPGGPFDCEHNVIAGNRIEGHPQGSLYFYALGGHCRHNVIRDNTIVVPAVARTPGASPGEAGVPLLLHVEPVGTRSVPSPADKGSFEENVIEANRIVGAEGLGMVIFGASRNRIAHNTLSGITRQDPFLGNLLELEGIPGEQWRAANGSGIWISPGSDENEILGNTFEDIAAHAVVLEGDRNRVELRTASDAVRDLGSGNRLIPAREGYASGADGVRLFYRFVGKGADTVVVLHGGPSLGLAYLAPDLEPLGRELTLLHYDQRGVGRSALPSADADLGVARHVADLEALRRHFNLDRLVLLGHSWGAMLAAHYAAVHPERVARMLFIDPMAPAATPYMAQAAARARLLMEERLDEPQRLRLDALALSWAEAEDPEAHCRAGFGILMRLYFADAGGAERTRGNFCEGSAEALRTRPSVDATILGALGDWDVRPLLSSIDVPVLIVHGGESAIPPEAMHAWADALPNTRLLAVAGAGHYLHVDRPDVFFPVALEFLGGSSPESAIRGYLDAYAAMDPDLLRAWTTDDFLLVENGYTAGFARLVEGMDPTGALPFTHYVLQDLEIEVAGEIAVYRMVVDWFRGEHRVDGGIGTGHLRQTDAGWKLARDHMTLLPARRPVTAEALREYAGEYRGLDATGGDDWLRLEVDGERLFMTRTDGRPLFGGIRRLELIPDIMEGFHLEFWGGLVEFERVDGGTVKTLVYVPPPRMPAAYRQPLRYERVE
jgi:proline iminopeptidase